MKTLKEKYLLLLGLLRGIMYWDIDEDKKHEIRKTLNEVEE